MRGWPLIRIETHKDLERAEMTWLLSNYDFGALRDTYMDDPRCVEEVEFEPVGRERVEFSIVVHDNLYHEQVEAYRGRDGKLYVTEEQIESMI